MKKIGFEIFKQDYLERNYNDPNLNIWYIENENGIIATMMMKKIEDNIGKIENVCCNKNYRGKGLSQKIFNEILIYARNNNLKKIKLGTYESLGRAIGFYQKNGFVENIEKRNAKDNSRFFEKIID